MKIYDGYILAVEFYKKANKSASWVHIVKNIQVEYMGYVPVVKIETLPEKYKAIAKKCQNLKNYCNYSTFSIEIGRAKDFMGVLEHQRKKAKKKPFVSKKIEGYKLLELSNEFIEQVEKGLIPYKLGQKDNKEDFKVIIEMQGMKIGFY